MNLTRRAVIVEALLRAVVQAQGGTAVIDLSKLSPDQVLVSRRVDGDTWELQIRPRLDGIKELQESRRPKNLELVGGRPLEAAI